MREREGWRMEVGCVCEKGRGGGGECVREGGDM